MINNELQRAEQFRWIMQAAKQILIITGKHNDCEKKNSVQINDFAQ